MNGYLIGEYYVSDGSKPIETKIKMPIEWMVLEQHADGKALLFSRNVLDWEIYGCDKLLTWENSYMKKYLSELYKTMFSPEEKDAIIPGDLGLIFLLSEAEIRKYLPSKESRRAMQYFVETKEDGEVRLYVEHYLYWLRINKCFRDEIPTVDSLGEITETDGDSDEVGIRIAMWVDAKKAQILTAKRGFNHWHHNWEPEEF